MRINWGRGGIWLSGEELNVGGLVTRVNGLDTDWGVWAKREGEARKVKIGI